MNENPRLSHGLCDRLGSRPILLRNITILVCCEEGFETGDLFAELAYFGGEEFVFAGVPVDFLLEGGEPLFFALAAF